MLADGLKVVLVAGDKGGTDATGGKGNKDIEAQISNLLGTVMLTASHGAEDLSRLIPMVRSRRKNLAALQKVTNKPSLNNGRRTP